MFKLIYAVVVMTITLTWIGHVVAKEIMPMYGGVLIEGYEIGKDTGPKGTLSYDPTTNQFKGTYRGLKMPEKRRAIFAWVHDTVNQKSKLLGVVGSLAKDGRTQFSIDAPDDFRNGQFGSYEIVGFTAEDSDALDGSNVITQPKEPSGTLSVPAPAFYLFSALPGADTERHWCGMGQDFFYAKDTENQTFYDCKCGVKYSLCIATGLAIH